MSAPLNIVLTSEMLARLTAEARAEVLLLVGEQRAPAYAALGPSASSPEDHSRCGPECSLLMHSGAAAAAGGGGPGIYPPIWRSAASLAAAPSPPPALARTSTLEAPPWPATPPRMAPPTTPPGAPRRIRPAEAYAHLPEDPIHCPLHACHSQLPGAPALGYSRNSSGRYGMFAPNGNGICTVCRGEDRELDIINEMWRALEAAQNTPTDDNIRDVMNALDAFRTEGMEHRYTDAAEVQAGLDRLRAGLRVELRG